ncbi:MAG: hypothetical protein HYT80_11650 [Euryarchaeota archaeon]|nr:hypothetical protein [Euryarchaeota archaeon]
MEPPLIGAVFFAQDANGTDVLPSKPPVRLTEGARPYVLAVVGDNAMVRQVLLLFRVGTQAVELPMEPVAGSDGLFSGQLPLLATGGPAQATVRAVDTWDNLEEKTVAVEIENPLLVGNQVLFVFSGILFLSSVVIWLKVRRKGVA